MSQLDLSYYILIIGFFGIVQVLIIEWVKYKLNKLESKIKKVGGQQ